MTLYGHDSQMAMFRAALSGERMHHAWLLSGPRGVGKAGFGDSASRLLLDAENPSSQGAKLIDAGSHPDLRRLERLPHEKTGTLARNITVDQVRFLRSLFAMGTAISKRRVVIIDSIDDMERSAANALLKSLEEPPESTIFLVVSHQPGQLLPTIRSRCRTLLFSPLDAAAMTSALTEKLPQIDAASRSQLIASANGSPAKALAYDALDLGVFDAALIELARTGDPSNIVRSKLAQTLALKGAQLQYEAFLGRVAAFLADRARQSTGPALSAALNAWGQARDLSQKAIPQSLVPETVVFEMAGYVASLATTGRVAKA